ncbi:hypothetical protein [Cellulosimicrobium sp. SL-1]|uniref:hypothetical protein n=1 Tax=Cellulosimicrobium sp. SL-1 TaxID=2699423 RepID=UPI0013D825D8|nr:hypothetical protein [Cellulosimicrobium sp. SL-1]
MSPEVWGILGVVVGGILGGFAQVIAALLQHSTERRREAERIRREAYRIFLVRIDEMTQAIVAVGATVERQQAGREALIPPERIAETMTATIAKFSDASLGVDLYGSGAVRASAKTMSKLLRSVQMSDLGLKDGWFESLESVLEPLAGLREELIAAMRVELHVAS